jgi:type IV secretory pathway VirB6-like protein
VIAGSYASFAVGIVLGPLFIPWLIFKETSWLFHGWFKTTLQFAFLPVVAMAYSMVMEQFIFAFLNTVPPTVGIAEYFVYLYQSIAVVLTMAFGTLSVPSLATSFFTGHPHHSNSGAVMLAMFTR